MEHINYQDLLPLMFLAVTIFSVSWWVWQSPPISGIWPSLEKSLLWQLIGTFLTLQALYLLWCLPESSEVSLCFSMEPQSSLDKSPRICSVECSCEMHFGTFHSSHSLEHYLVLSTRPGSRTSDLRTRTFSNALSSRKCSTAWSAIFHVQLNVPPIFDVSRHLSQNVTFVTYEHFWGEHFNFWKLTPSPGPSVCEWGLKQQNFPSNFFISCFLHQMFYG